MLKCLSIALMAALSTSAACSAGGNDEYGCVPTPERPPVELPLEFDVAARSMLYLYGERVFRVRLSSAPGETLYMNGIPIKPVAHREPPWEVREYTDDDYLRWVGSAPFVQQLLETGVPPKEAANAYVAAREKVYSQLQRAYMEAAEAGQSDSAASVTALAKLPDLDTHELVDWSRPSRGMHRGVLFYWKGFEDHATLQFESPRDVRNMIGPDEEDKRSMATHLYYTLTGERSCFVYIGIGGGIEIWGAHVVADVERELEEVRRSGDFSALRFLNEHAAREILLKEAERAGLPN